MESKSPIMEEKMVALDKNNEHEGGEEKKAPIEEKEEYPGFRFHPTDEELVTFYLRRKVEKKTLSIAVIKEIDIYKYDPWDLPKVSNVGEKEWYFFCLRGRKYRNSIRPNRVTGSGFWKATGIDRPIYPASEHHRECIGLKKSLVYYRGSAGKGTKTDWMMHEFRLPSNNVDSTIVQEAEIWTICRILKRNMTYKKYAPSWKDSLTKQIPADSSSKSSSFDSGVENEYKGFGATTFQQGDQKLATTYTQETNQSFAGQWNPMAQSPVTPLPLPTNLSSLSSNEFYRQEGVWDELGYMIDPALIYDSRYF